jgi:hypothetical protein
MSQRDNDSRGQVGCNNGLTFFDVFIVFLLLLMAVACGVIGNKMSQRDNDGRGQEGTVLNLLVIV